MLPATWNPATPVSATTARRVPPLLLDPPAQALPPLMLPAVYMKLKLAPSLENLVVAERKIEMSRAKSRTKRRSTTHLR
jgi:hypothetical protein